MYITDESKAVQARKAALSFHTRHKIKSINDLSLHAMDWTALCGLEKDARKSAAEAIDRASDADGESRSYIEGGIDGFTDLLSEISNEKDERTAAGSKEPREQRATSTQLAKRPGVDAISTGASDDAEITDVELRSNQSMKTWAQARSSTSDHLRGMNAGQFLRSMIVNDKTDVERRALAEATDSAGGYTVPDVLSAELIDKARASSVVMRAGARTVPLTSDKNTIAKVLTDPTPAWRAEAGAVANSDGTFGAVVLTPRSLAVSVDISSELMADSLNLGTALPKILAAAMAVELDRVALIGSGTAPEPRGVANTVGIGTFAQDAAIASYANLSKARTGILTANRGPVSAFIMHPRDEGTFVDLTDTTDQPLMAPKAVSDIPILTTTSLPVDAGVGNDESTIIAGNFSRLLVGIRSGIQIELFKGPKYISNLQYTMVAHLRADIAVEDPGAFYTLTGVGKAA
ncbi:phage major capsid protein [Sulfitobacter pontiacus]|uniref:phage major capsid protein n=1 Tax=Sulfitobacter pontiacus TaxID=60137 RepID=UPI0036DCC81A